MLFLIISLFLKFSALANLRSVYDPLSGFIKVTWEEPPDSAQTISYTLIYDSPYILKQKIVLTSTKHYRFKPPHLGTIYTIKVYADRKSTGRSPEAEVLIPYATG